MLYKLTSSHSEWQVATRMGYYLVGPLEVPQMPDAKRFEETALSPDQPCVTDSVTVESCCLCERPITEGQVAEQRFSTDRSGETHRAHAACAHEFSKLVRAFHRAANA